MTLDSESSSNTDKNNKSNKAKTNKSNKQKNNKCNNSKNEENTNNAAKANAPNDNNDARILPNNNQISGASRGKAKDGHTNNRWSNQFMQSLLRAF